MKRDSVNHTLAKNIDRLMRERGLVQASLSKKSGVAQTTISLYLNPDRRQPSKTGKIPSAKLTEVEALADALDIPLTDLLSPNLKSSASDFLVSKEAANEDHAPILMVDAKASAGRGSVVFSDDTSKTLMFRRDWLAKKGAKPDSVLAFTVDGDSMADAYIPEGSVVLANKCPEEPISGRIYVVWIGDQLFVKKLHKENDTWVARSCNKKKAYPDIPINADSGVVGQVFWCGFEL